MERSDPTPTLIVVYARDIARVAEFYRRTVALARVAEEPDFIVVGAGELEIAVVRMSAAIARETHISVPPRLREETPIKASFRVDDLRRVEVDAGATGGGTRPLANAWRWRDQLHLDGFDPEGNRVQFRQRAPAATPADPEPSQGGA
jgi:hypothetical protein